MKRTKPRDCTKEVLIVAYKQCVMKDFWHFTKVLFRHGFEWDHGISSFSLPMNNSRNFIRLIIASEQTNKQKKDLETGNSHL